MLCGCMTESMAKWTPRSKRPTGAYARAEQRRRKGHSGVPSGSGSGILIWQRHSGQQPVIVDQRDEQTPVVRRHGGVVVRTGGVEFYPVGRHCFTNSSEAGGAQRGSREASATARGVRLRPPLVPVVQTSPTPGPGPQPPAPRAASPRPRQHISRAIANTLPPQAPTFRFSYSFTLRRLRFASRGSTSTS